MSEEEKANLATCLQELSKVASQASKIIAAAEGALTKTITMAEVELINMNLEKLRDASLEAEEVHRQNLI